MSKELKAFPVDFRNAEPRQESLPEPAVPSRSDQRGPWVAPAVIDVELAAEVTAYVGRR